MRFKAFGDNAMERVVWSFGLLWLKESENKDDRTFLFSPKKVIHQKEEISESAITLRRMSIRSIQVNLP